MHHHTIPAPVAGRSHQRARVVAAAGAFQPVEQNHQRLLFLQRQEVQLDEISIRGGPALAAHLRAKALDGQGPDGLRVGPF
jgi:hypothetical protein